MEWHCAVGLCQEDMGQKTGPRNRSGTSYMRRRDFAIILDTATSLVLVAARIDFNLICCKELAGWGRSLIRL